MELPIIFLASSSPSSAAWSWGAVENESKHEGLEGGKRISFTSNRMSNMSAMKYFMEQQDIQSRKEHGKSPELQHVESESMLDVPEDV